MQPARRILKENQINLYVKWELETIVTLWVDTTQPSTLTRDLVNDY